MHLVLFEAGSALVHEHDGSIECVALRQDTFAFEDAADGAVLVVFGHSD